MWAQTYTKDMKCGGETSMDLVERFVEGKSYT